MANETKYWKGLAHLKNEQKFVEKNQNEFAEYIPVEEFISDKKTLESSSTNRRDFLKFLGFSTVAATLAACETPVVKAIPYVQRPEDVIPGVANWYASTFFDGHDFASILIKTREGRPIKLEANPLSKITGSGNAKGRGGLNARVQSSVLSLYDSTRVQCPMMKSGNAWVSKNWKDIDTEIGAKLAQSKGIAIISSSIESPSTRASIAEFASKYKNVRHVMYDAISYSGILKANNSSFGKAFVPTYSFDKADVIVSLGCDFLVNWVSPVEHARQYAMGRKVGGDKKTMSKHFQFESILSVTGSNADERFPVKPSQLGAVALGILAGVGGSVSAPSVMQKEVGKVSDALKNAKGKALVVCGSNDPAVQLVVNEINKALNAYGTTISTDVIDLTHQGDDAAMKKVVDDFGGTIDTVIFYNSNPAYTAPAALKFEEAMKKLSCRISFSGHKDETAVMCDYICPDHHYLEAWNDHYPRTKQYNLQQPGIRPLFSTRHAQETLLIWAGNNSDYHSYLQKNWNADIFGMQNSFGDFTAFWNNSVRDGVVELVLTQMPVVADPQVKPAKNNKKPAADSIADAQSAMAAHVATMMPAMDSVSFTGGILTLNDAVSQINSVKGGKYELTIYQKTSMGSGNQSQNPWLQEMPDPITKITWDNYITMHPLDVKSMNLFGLLEDDDLLVRFDEIEDQLDVAEVTANGQKIKLPVWFQPGQARGTIGIAVGYGRKGFNEIIDGVGQNIYPSVSWNETAGTMNYDVYDVSIADSGDDKHQIASTQVHSTIMGRNEDLLRETNLASYAKDERAGNPLPMMHTYAGEKNPEDVNLWNSFERPNHKWALAIDLNSCIGCGACVVSCNAENNIAVVGKDQVRKSREMHWMRIDRYYSSHVNKEEEQEKGDMGTRELYRKMESPEFDNPKVVFQPLMCQHCNHAPCETVCPVLATTHSTEGLNQMVYNRCVGTRYCANNCPFKVRRFNWFNYNEYYLFKGINPTQDTLASMVLNPDVVVRTRGVMEKCSMCVQRIQAGKLDAKKAGRRPIDGDIQTACTQSCPTNAIIFGDLNDEKSEISQWEQSGRKFEMLEEIGIRPSVFYLTKIWNREDEKAHV
ncbi:MAG: TAT-variant-translocated molybdopterin oxidoreductase [Bacteroidetes bacterium]|nr:TAT-variant-translocated molybdopterin oxidoreductase [Bacteroidota bacterium]